MISFIYSIDNSISSISHRSEIMIKIIAMATGLAAILGAGSILLAAIGNIAWIVFLFVAFLVFVAGKGL